MTPASASPVLADERARETTARRPHAEGMLVIHMASCAQCASGTACAFAVELERVASGGGSNPLAERMQRAKSVYVLPCPCGEKLHTHEAAATCTNCGRELRVENWGKKS